MRRVFGQLLILASLLLFASCEQPEQHKAEFPTPTTIECMAGDKVTLEFSVDSNWQLSSDATRCKFITAAGEVLDTSGKAGRHTMTLRIGSEGLKDEVTKANISMKLNGESRTIATIERGAKELTLKVYNSEGKNTESIEIGYSEWITTCIEANFRFAATDFPEWVEIEGGSITGAADERVEARLRIVPDGDRERFAFDSSKGHTITFADEAGKISFEFALTYKGMGEDNLTFTAPTANTFGWEVSLDGTIFQQMDEEEQLVTFNNSLEFSITAQDDNYAILYLEQVVDRGIPSYNYFTEEDDCWMHFDKATMTLEVDSTTMTRYGVVMALPMGLYNDIAADITGNIFELDYTSGIGIETLIYDMLRYVIIDFVQHDLEEKSAYEGMYIYHSLTTWEIPATRITNAELTEKYGTTEIFEAPFVNSVQGKRPGIIIDPRIEEWTTLTAEEGRATAEVWHGNTQLKISDNEYYMGENMEEVMSLHLWGPQAEFSENVVVVFKLDGMVRKLLVVTPPAK